MNKPVIKFNLSVAVIKEGDKFVAYSPALDLSSCGKTAKEARKRFSEAVGIFFEEIIKKGSFEEVLTDLGWKKINSIWNPPKIVSNGVQTFCVAA
jgi:predicted RNase H-like HicB family nuclease